MNRVKISVIIPTHNRSDKLAETMACFRRQSINDADYEIIIVDDGSSPPVELPRDLASQSKFKLVRLEGVERSAARNQGAAVAQGDILVFLDDDSTVESDFLAEHLSAHLEWPGSIVVGVTRLTDEFTAKPFGQFRHRLEQRQVPRERGPVASRNFCTAQNMSIQRDLFHELGGFDEALVSSEDQDLALRHTAQGGRIVFLPEAVAMHHDTALDIRSYSRRCEWGSEYMVAFCCKHPAWPDNVERERINGFARWGREPFSQSARKLFKQVLASTPVVALFFGFARVFELIAPRSHALDRIYRVLLGAHILRGYRRGLKRFAVKKQRIEAALSAESAPRVAHPAPGNAE